MLPSSRTGRRKVKALLRAHPQTSQQPSPRAFRHPRNAHREVKTARMTPKKSCLVLIARHTVSIPCVSTTCTPCTMERSTARNSRARQWAWCAHALAACARDCSPIKYGSVHIYIYSTAYIYIVHTHRYMGTCGFLFLCPRALRQRSRCPPLIGPRYRPHPKNIV